ncbi:MAG: hypothetical protein H7222_14010 [Methylotenera sp.]|nr:hypothetical protein [Oligoflexia bacterium]
MTTPFLADLHIHSSFSDGKHSIPELVDFYGGRDFGAIAITDHLCERRSVLGRAAAYLNRTLTEATFPIYQEILKSEAKRAWEKYRMVVIPGVEFTKNSLSNHRSAHVLGLGLTQWLDPEGDPATLARGIRAFGGVAIAAHPVSTRKLEKQTYHLWDHREELRAEFDAWEVASGAKLFDEILRSDLPKIASSDLHHKGQMTSWKTEFDCERNAEAIFQAIRGQELRFRFYQEKSPQGSISACDLVGAQRLHALAPRAAARSMRDFIFSDQLSQTSPRTSRL